MDGAFVEYGFGLAITTIAETSGNLDPISNHFEVRQALAAVTLKYFSVGDIIVCTPVIPVIAPRCKRGAGWNE
jgi:hypothetical protein